MNSKTKRVLHQEWLEKWLAGEDVEWRVCGYYGKYQPFTLEYCDLSDFDSNTFEFRTPPKLLTIDVDEFTTELTSLTGCNGHLKLHDVLEIVKDLLDKQESGNE